MKLPTPRFVTVCAALVAAGCATATPAVQHPSAEHLASLPESQALALIDSCLQEQKVEPEPGWAVELPRHAGGLPVDIRLGHAPVGIEWVSEQDRARYGQLLPAPDPSGQLRVLQGRDGAIVLLLDQATYRYEPGGARALLASRDLDSTADRLKRDVQDFIAYVKSQYAL
ncbi:MAG TPA: hypothetical protein VF331_01415 [Polyangiales bacterium]